ncbi:MAG: glycine zipper 2TM domain-containing protein [Gammaproteobacteria bacterium]|nr:glycine zipper 2TM domain-containing protein [Gammaproteobacteria bacterium]MBU1409445.1 glycine zipper 2TM domain-containing protein [Gammaproteobacteria bacterium]MBU1530627.1 glycine zipper 2TM domain-containing protein [Gammaproteobacteria bacterium]
MNKSMLTGVIAGAVAVTAIGGVAGYRALNPEPKFAEVLAVEPVTETRKTPKEVCEDVAVSEQAPVKDPNRIAGTAIGAVAGGLLGSQIGSGKGRTVGTVAGAAAGGYAGHQVQKSMQEKDTVTRIERRCKTVYESHTETIGYDVRYRLGEEEGLVRMDHPPGPRIPVKDGELQLQASATP